MNNIETTDLPYNVSANEMKQTILNTYAGILDVDVSRNALKRDDSFEWLVTFTNVKKNDTSGLIAGYNVVPILFNSQLYGGDGVYVASEEVQAGSFISGIVRYKDGDWFGLGGGIDETNGYVSKLVASFA